MSAVLSAVYGAGAQLFNNTGAPLAGGKIYTYLAGSTTPQATWTDSTQLVQNANPIVLDSGGRTTSEIWIANNTQYKFVVTDSAGNPIGISWDNVPGINQSNVVQSEWVTGTTPTYASPTSFTVSGNQTATYAALRRVQYYLTSGTYYGSIASSTYNGSTLTTVVIVPDSTNLNSSLSGVNYGFIAGTPSSIPSVSGINAASVQAQTYTSFTTGGTTSAYTLTPSPVVSGNVPGQCWDVTFNSTNLAGATLAVNGNTAMTLVKEAGNGGYAALGAGDVVSNWVSSVVVLSGGTQALVRQTINPSVGVLTATSLVGNVTGNVSGTAGSTATYTGTLSAIGAAASGANTDITSLAAPALGAATATTQSAADSSTKVATTAMVQSAIAAEAVALTGNQTVAGVKTFSSAPVIGSASLTVPSGTAPLAPARAWCVFNGLTTGTNAPLSGGNVASVTRNGTGDYTITFTTAMTDANYAVTATVQPQSGNNAAINMIQLDGNNNPTTSAVRVHALASGIGLVDMPLISIVIFR